MHDVLYRPQEEPDEQTLEHILISLASALREIELVLSCVAGQAPQSESWRRTLRTAANLATEICSTCVPRTYAPNLSRWMDRIQELATAIA